MSIPTASKLNRAKGLPCLLVAFSSVIFVTTLLIGVRVLRRRVEYFRNRGLLVTGTLTSRGMILLGLRSNRSTKARHAEVLVFAADEDLIDGISHCTKLISNGISAEFSTCPTLDAAMEYAKANKIGRIDIIDKEKNEQPVTMTL